VAQPTTANEIVVATHGRSIWILDVNTLRQLAPPATTSSTATSTATTGDPKASPPRRVSQPFQEPVTLFAPAPVVRWKLETGRLSPYSRDVRKFVGENPVRGAVFDYLLTRAAKTISLKVTDINGNTLRDFRNLATEPGFHRVTWNLSASGGTGRTGRGAGLGVAIPAGTYRVVLTVDGKDYSQPLIVENDPKADPRAIISFDIPIPTFEDEEEEEHRRDHEDDDQQDHQETHDM